MVILAMDTATDQLSLALGKESGEVRASWTSSVPKMHATLFHPLLDQMLSAVNLGLQDIGAIVVGVGPGSYTGVRIAVTAAKVFSYTLNIPVITVSSLEVAAYAARAHRGLVVPVWDARRQAAYCAVFRSEPSINAWERILPDGRREFSQLVQEVLEVARGDEKVMLLGNAASSIVDFFHQKGEDGNVGVYDERTHISGELIFRVGLRTIQEQPDLITTQGMWEPVHDLVPNYVQMAEAQARLLPDRQGG